MRKNCGKEIPEDHIAYCNMSGAPVCEECGTTRLSSTCAELWESEIDPEEMEAKEEFQYTHARGQIESLRDHVHPFV